MSWRPGFSVIMVDPRPPVEALQLAQQATLETRDPKHEPRSLAEQRTAWHAEAVETLGGPEAVQAMISKAVNPISIKRPELNAEWVAATAEKVLAAVEEHRSTWQSWHVRAEVLRQIRAAEIDAGKVDRLVELLVAEVLQTRAVALARAEDNISEPAELRRADGSSVYTVAGWAPGSGVERQRRPGNRVGTIRGRCGAAPRRHLCTSRNVGETHLVHPPRRAARLGGTHRPVDVCDHQRGRDGRHPLIGHRRPVHHRSSAGLGGPAQYPDHGRS